jgi:hypothetical protein
MPIKMCFRRTPQFAVMRHRAGIPSWRLLDAKNTAPAWGKLRPKSKGGMPCVGMTLVWARNPQMPIKFGVKRPRGTHTSQRLNAPAIVFHRLSFDLYAAGSCH